MTDHTGIDYAALAKDAYGRDPIPTEWDVDFAWDDTTDAVRQSAIQGVRAVIKALGDQGLAIVRVETLRELRSKAGESQ